jgi:hypothetical protein
MKDNESTLTKLAKLKARTRVFLCDVSSSMAEIVDLPSYRRIDHLRALLDQFDDPAPLWIFSHEARRSSVEEIRGLMPFGNTALDMAFDCLIAEGYRQVVLLSDGEPDDPDAALAAARGLQLEVIYIGTPPMPDFMRRLAQYCGGSATLIGTKPEDLPRLTKQVQKLLGWERSGQPDAIKM